MQKCSSRSVTVRKPLALAVSIMAALLLPASSAWAEYKISAGDVLSLSVAGLPELATKMTVDIDGNAAIPLVGPVPVSGLSVTDALGRLRAALPGKEYRHRTDDGREFPVIISPDEISLSVFEYRPVYINGDVARPGSEPYKPGLTVRQAVALAGGYDVLRFKMDNPFLQLSDLTSEYSALWIDYAKGQALIARLQAELGGKQDLDARSVIDTPVARSLTRDIIDNQRGQLALRIADFDKEQVYLKNAAAKESDRAKILNEQQSKEQDGVKADGEDLQRYTDLYKRGAVALPGLADARRTVLLSSTRALQTTALLDSVEREQQDLSRRLDRTGDTRRIKLLDDLQDATTALAATRAKLQAVSDKLRYTGMVKSQLVRGDDSRPKVTIVRNVEGKRTEITASVDAELQPDDTVEIALQIADAAAPVSQ